MHLAPLDPGPLPGGTLAAMSNAAPSTPPPGSASGRVRDPASQARMVANATAWTDQGNWDGDEYTGPGLPPWGTKPRCPVVRNGRRCRKSCIPGGSVCNTHGGAAPQVKRRAQLRLLSLVDPAIGALARTLGQTQDEALRTKIAFGILDRTGLGKATDVSADVAKALLMDRYYAMREKAEAEEREREAAGLPTLEGEWSEDDAVDAELVPDDEYSGAPGSETKQYTDHERNDP